MRNSNTDNVVECIILEKFSRNITVLANYSLTPCVDVEQPVNNRTDAEEDSPPPMGASRFDLRVGCV